jgi:hypothetical protein
MVRWNMLYSSFEISFKPYKSFKSRSASAVVVDYDRTVKTLLLRPTRSAIRHTCRIYSMLLKAQNSNGFYYRYDMISTQSNLIRYYLLPFSSLVFPYFTAALKEYCRP